MAEAFYEHLGDGRFFSTKNTAGPWSEESQHGGPPAGLLVRELEARAGDRPGLLARITLEILGPVPVADLWVESQVERAGSSVQLLSATLRTADRAVAKASAWWIARGDTAGQEVGAAQPIAPVDQGRAIAESEEWTGGYLNAMEWVGVAGSFSEPGPGIVWARQRMPLVAGEEPTPMQRLLTAVDSASGVSSWFDPSEWLFINTELTVHLQRQPVGEWIGMDANTVIGPEGVGTALAVLHDQRGQVGNSAQALLVRRRSR